MRPFTRHSRAGLCCFAADSVILQALRYSTGYF